MDNEKNFLKIAKEKIKKYQHIKDKEKLIEKAQTDLMIEMKKITQSIENAELYEEDSNTLTTPLNMMGFKNDFPNIKLKEKTLFTKNKFFEFKRTFIYKNEHEFEEKFNNIKKKFLDYKGDLITKTINNFSNLNLYIEDNA